MVHHTEKGLINVRLGCLSTQLTPINASYLSCLLLENKYINNVVIGRIIKNHFNLMKLILMIMITEYSTCLFSIIPKGIVYYCL